MSIDPTQSSLLRAVRGHGADDAWRRFDARYGPPVVAFALSRGVQLSDAEDLRQSVMLRLSGALGEFRYDRSRGRFRDYVFTIARRELIRAGAHPARRARVGSLGAIDPASPQEREAWEAQWERHRLRCALATLAETENDRNMAILRRLVGGERATSIGADLGMSAESVRKAAQRLRDRLRDLLERDEDEPT